MQRIIKELKSLINNESYYSSVFLALSLIDVCSKKEYPTISRDGERYKKWLETYYNPYYSFVTAYEMWKMRCKVLHEGTTFIDENCLTRVILTRGTSHQNMSTISYGEQTIIEKQLNVKLFLKEILHCIVEWSKSKTADELELDFSIDEIFSTAEVNGSQGFRNCN